MYPDINVWASQFPLLPGTLRAEQSDSSLTGRNQVLYCTALPGALEHVSWVIKVCRAQGPLATVKGEGGSCVLTWVCASKHKTLYQHRKWMHPFCFTTLLFVMFILRWCTSAKNARFKSYLKGSKCNKTLLLCGVYRCRKPSKPQSHTHEELGHKMMCNKR